MIAPNLERKMLFWLVNNECTNFNEWKVSLISMERTTVARSRQTNMVDRTKTEWKSANWTLKLTSGSEEQQFCSAWLKFRFKSNSYPARRVPNVVVISTFFVLLNIIDELRRAQCCVCSSAYFLNKAMKLTSSLLLLFYLRFRRPFVYLFFVSVHDHFCYADWLTNHAW